MWVALLVGLVINGEQSRQDARPLLQAVAEASRNLTAFRAEGRIEQLVDIGIIKLKEDLTFRVTTQSSRWMRIEVRGGEEWVQGLPFTATCDGHTGWAYFEKGNYYRKAEDDAFGGHCTPGTLTGFSGVADNLTSAVITGTGESQFEGRSQPCTEVEAHYRVIEDLMVPPGMVFKVGRVTRHFCIDPQRKLVLRYRIDADVDATPNADRVKQSVTYDRIELNPTLPEKFFEFQPPSGSKPWEIPTLPPLATPPPSATAPQPAPRVYRVMRSPEPVAKVEPEYSQEAWDEGIQGSVILVADIAPDGAMGNVQVRQSLGYGLDEKAIECVRKWRFSPATDDGKPVKGEAYIQLRFSLPSERPARPSPGPVSRPVPRPRPTPVELTSPTDEDDFFHIVAFNFKAPQVCARIRPMVLGDVSPNADRGSQIRDMRSWCYDALAAVLRDASLCDRVTPVSMEFLDGSKYDKSACLEGVKAKGTYGSMVSPNPWNLGPLVRFMRQIGYDDRQVANWKYLQNPEGSDTWAAYDELRKQQDFLARVAAAPTYAEPRAAASIRAANPLEFLYQMVAIDSVKPELCAKVSPNATFTDLGGQIALLRSRCFLAFAFNLRQARFCDELPRTGSFPHINTQYDSLEHCKDTVAIYSRPDFKGNPEYGAAAFPHYADFETALQRLGYSEDYARSRVPAPSPELYWDFLFMMSLQGDAAQKSELVRRVLAM